MRLGEEYQRRLLAIAIAVDARIHGKRVVLQSFLNNLTELLFTAAGILLGFFVLRVSPVGVANKVSSAMAFYISKREPPALDRPSVAQFKKIQENGIQKQICNKIKDS